MDTKPVTQVRKNRIYSYQGDTVKVIDTSMSVGVKMVRYFVVGTHQDAQSTLYSKFVRLAQEYVDQSAFKPKAESL